MPDFLPVCLQDFLHRRQSVLREQRQIIQEKNDECEKDTLLAGCPSALAQEQSGNRLRMRRKV